MNKPITILTILLFAALGSMAQQTAQYTQYTFNHYGLNPAVGGSSNCLDIKVGYRLQWYGFPGAPRTGFLSVHGAIGKKRYNTKGWHGLGVYLETDDTGPYSYKGIYPSYAYHLRIGRRMVAALGFFAGVRQHVYQGNTLAFGSPDPLQAGQSALVYPDITPGLYLYNKKFFLGISAKQVYRNTMSGAGTIGSPSKLNQHYHLTFARIIESKSYYYTYIPSLHIKYTLLYPPAIDLGFMMFIKKKVGYGISYRYPDAVNFLVQYNFWRNFTIGYSFDFTLSKIRNGTIIRTHEAILGFNPCAQKGIPPENCPAYDNAYD